MNRGPAVALALLVITLVQPVTSVRAQPCAAVEYVDSLRAAERALVAPTPLLPVAREALQRAAALGGGYAVAPVEADLAEHPPNIGESTRRLESAVAALGLTPGSGCRIDPRPALDTLHGVYGSRVFAGLDRTPGQGGLERMVDSAASALVDAARVAGGLWSPAVMLLVAALLLGAVRWRRGGDRRGVIVSASPEAHDSASLDADVEWRAGAAAAAVGDHREAVRRAFHSCLLTLRHRGRLIVDPSWTTHQMLGQAVRDPELVSVLVPAATSFDRAWYSTTPVGAAEWERARRCCEAVRRVAAQPSKVRA